MYGNCIVFFNQMKQMNQAAVLIQKYYRRYKNSLARSKELERAAIFIQQMYRYDDDCTIAMFF